MHLVLFDIDGTLIKGGGMGGRALRQAFEEVFSVSAVENSDLDKVHFGGRTDPAIITDMATALNLQIEDPLHPTFVEAFLRHLRSNVDTTPELKTCPFIPELLQSLHDDPRVCLGLITGNMEPGARIKLDPFELNPFFPIGGFGEDGFERQLLVGAAIERGRNHYDIGFDPEEVVVIGDTQNDIKAGQAHGCLTVGVATGWVEEENLKQANGSAVFKDLSPENGFASWLDEQLS